MRFIGRPPTLSRPLVDGKSPPALAITSRNFDAEHLPSSDGPLILIGDQSREQSGSAAQRFVSFSGESNARLAVLVFGYVRNADAQAYTKEFAAALQTQAARSVSWFVVDSKVNQAAIQNAIASTIGILVTAPNYSLVLNSFAGAPSITSALWRAFTKGKAQLVDNSVAAALGQAASAGLGPTSTSLYDGSLGDFLFANASIQPGLNWMSGVPA
jgi:hypothetical protein